VKRHNHHEQALKIIVEDLKDYQNALTYIATLNFFEVLGLFLSPPPAGLR
jgi:hypothetical protein